MTMLFALFLYFLQFKFRDEIENRGGEFKNTIFSFTEKEGEVYTLTRWLRARKFKYDDVITMVEEAIECRSEARHEKYYPDPVAALGVDPAIYIDQYPQLYSGFAKNGCPVYFSKPGVLNIDAIECVTSLSGILNYHWHVMQHDYLQRLLEYKEKNPSFKRFESVSILDLNHLSTSQLNGRTLGIIKKQSFVDSLCFPETMNKMIIVNAPRTFSLTWKLIRGWLDQRTANKIEIFSNKSAMQVRLLELIDENELPSDYGGKATDTVTTLRKNFPSGITRIETETMHLRTHLSHVLEVKEGEEIDLMIFTRGTVGANFEVYDENKVQIIKEVEVIHKGTKGSDTENPTMVKLTASRLSGPSTLKVKATSKGGRLHTENFFLVGKVYRK